MNYSHVVFLLLCLWFSGIPQVGYGLNNLDIDKDIITPTLNSKDIETNLKELCLGIGARPAGTEAMTKAMLWAENVLIQSGVDKVFNQSFISPPNWLPGIEQAEFSVVSNKEEKTKPLLIAAMPFSPSTDAKGLEAEVYDIGIGDKKAFEQAGEAIKGKWILVYRPLTVSMTDLLNEYNDKPFIMDQAKEREAAGILWLSSRPGTLLYRHNLTFNGKKGFLPAAVIERAEGENILALLKSGHKVKAKLRIESKFIKSPINYNVMAEIKGSEKPDEIIMLGAHLDSWDLGQGALDNGANVVLVINAARQLAHLAELGYRPKRTIRFMLFGAEEQGLYGSWFNVENNNKKDIDKIRALVVYDMGSGRTKGYALGGRKDMLEITRRALDPISKFGPFDLSLEMGIDSDNFDYFLAGIPTLFAKQNEEPYLADYHAQSDTIDKVDIPELKRNTAIAAVLIWNLANDPHELIKRQSRKERLALIKSTGMEEEMKTLGIWNYFDKEHRGEPYYQD